MSYAELMCMDTFMCVVVLWDKWPLSGNADFTSDLTVD